MNTLERQLLIEQTKKEFAEDMMQYEIGLLYNGELIATKNSDWDGHVFVIPENKYNELLRKYRQ